MRTNKPLSEDERATAGVRQASAPAAPAISLSALKEQADGLRRAQLMANLAHVITRPDGSFESWSETLPGLLGIKDENVAISTRRWLDLIHPEDRGLFRSTALQARSDRRRAEIEYRIWRAGSSWIYLRQVMEPIPGQADAEGRTRWFNTIQDITASKQAEQRIKRLNRVYAVLSGINTLIVRARNRDELFAEACRIAIEHGQFTMAWIGLVDNQAGVVKPVATAGNVGDFFDAAPMAVLENRPGGHGLSGRAVRAKKPMISNDMRSDPQRLMKKELEARNINSVAILPLIVGGEAIGVLALYASDSGFFDDEEMRLLLELAGDISFALDHLDKADRINYLAYYDALTGLANRALFLERLGQKIRDARSGSGSGKLAVWIVDIERFKAVNDAFGRQSGDELLQQLAARMKAVGKDETGMARLGADHFAVVSDAAQNESDIARLTEGRLQQLFESPFTIGGQDLRVSAHFGIALFPQDGTDGEALVHSAEAALKNAKAGGERYLFFAREMTARIAEKLALENRLRQALDKQEFVLYYQPKVDLDTRAVVGVEALIRWQSPDKGLVPPAHFIPLLEETGLILQVGAWALERAARDHRAWTEQKLNAPRVAVNVSAVQLRQRDFVGVVEQAIGLAPTAIDLEITESLVMEDIESNIEKLKAVRALGMDIAIDDFGTGYSSLGYLARLPVQALKIDRSFIIRMQQDPNAMTLVSTIISLAHSLRLKVVAEGVETEEQANFLRLLRCDEMQGYLFSKPVPAEQLVALLKTG